MTGPRFLIVLCVLLIQRAASQTCDCQTELFISIDDLMNALNNGPGIPGLTNQGCGCQSNQQSGVNQPSCGCQPSQPQPSISINRPSISLGQPCGCNQPNSCSCNQPSLSLSSLPLSFGQSCGNQISLPSQPIALSLQSCGNQPSISLSNQQCGCNLPSISLGNQCSCNQPSVSLSNQCGCNQPSISLSNQCGCNLPSISLGNQCSCNQPSVSLSNQCSCNQPISFQSIPVGNQIVTNIPSGSSCGCNQRNQIAISSDDIASCVVPAALLQAPPYGVQFAGENLLIDGAVQVCGNMPFNSIVELAGIMPTSGSGCVQYVCNDLCEF